MCSLVRVMPLVWAPSSVMRPSTHLASPASICSGFLLASITAKALHTCPEHQTAEATTYIGHHGCVASYPYCHACGAILPVRLLALGQHLSIGPPEGFTDGSLSACCVFRCGLHRLLCRMSSKACMKASQQNVGTGSHNGSPSLLPGHGAPTHGLQRAQYASHHGHQKRHRRPTCCAAAYQHTQVHAPMTSMSSVETTCRFPLHRCRRPGRTHLANRSFFSSSLSAWPRGACGKRVIYHKGPVLLSSPPSISTLVPLSSAHADDSFTFRLSEVGRDTLARLPLSTCKVDGAASCSSLPLFPGGSILLL